MTPRWAKDDRTAESIGAPEKARRGRRPRTIVDQLVTQAWYHEISRRLGITSNRGVERHFEPNKVRKNPVSGEWMRPCKFDKYHRGENTPSMQVRAIVEKELAGTSEIFDLALWRVIDRPIPGVSELQAVMSAFGIRLKAILFEVDRSVGTMQPVYRRRKLNERDYPEIRKQGDLEALTCLLALARESEWTNDEAQHKHATAWAMRLLFALWIFPPLSGITHEIWNYLKAEFFSRSYVDLVPLNSEAINVDGIVLAFTEILLLMEDAGVLNGYDFQQQARLFWHADLGNLSSFLEDARLLNDMRDLKNWRIREKLLRKYKGLVRTPLFKIVEMNLMGNDRHP